MDLTNAPVSIDAWTFDAGMSASSAREFVAEVRRCIQESIAAGARIVLFPELLWLGLRPFEKDNATLATRFWETYWPELRRTVSDDVFLVAGTAPWREPSTGELRNRAVVSLGEPQDKLYLTPWENDFSRGHDPRVYTFGGLRIAVLICLDVEVPELAVSLRGEEIDLLLVPSATDSLLGVERIHRCASARAVELGCAVVVSALTGNGPVETISENLGRAALYLPSQSPLLPFERQQVTEVHHGGSKRYRFTVDFPLLRRCRSLAEETNPARLRDVQAPRRQSDLDFRQDSPV